jgi:hypothetical protein
MVQVIGLDAAKKFLGNLPRDARKAASKAINDTLKDVQGQTRDILEDSFTLRGRGKQWHEAGMMYGFNIRPFSKPETLEGIIGSSAPWLEIQSKGGTRQRDGNLAIPASDYKPKTSIMAKRLKPRAIIGRGRNPAFFAKLKTGFSGIFRRVGDDLKLLFSLKGSAQYEKRLDYPARAGAIANKRFAPNFAKRFKETFLK